MKTASRSRVSSFMFCAFMLIFWGGLAAQAQQAQLVSPSPASSGQFGYAVANVPDVNADGLQDIAISAYGEGVGKLYLYSGQTRELLRTMSSADTINHQFGACAAGIGDLNSNSAGDIIVGAPGEKASWDGAGKVYIFDGGTGSTIRTLTSPNAFPSGAFGCSVASIADVNSDGCPDIIIGAMTENVSGSALGRAYVYSGSNGTLIRTLVSPSGGNYYKFGNAVASVPDTNGNGSADILVGEMGWSSGSSSIGRAHLFDGSTGALLLTLNSTNPTLMGYFGYAVAGLPDVTGDGCGDLLIAAKGENIGGNSGAGRCYVFNGATGSLVYTATPPTPNGGTYFGMAVAALPDMNGDGKADFLVGAQGYPSLYSGRAFLCSGADGSVLRTLAQPVEVSYSYFGSAVSALGDMNGDGLGELIVGAPSDKIGAAPTGSGAAYLFMSGPEVKVSEGATAIADGGGPRDYGANYSGYPALTKTFTVRNTGIHSLTISNLTVPEGYVISEGLSGTIAPDASDTFTVDLPTTNSGTYAGDIGFDTNQPGLDHFNFSVTGTIWPAAPEVVVLNGATEIGDGGATTDFGSVLHGRQTTKTFTVKNIGSLPLTTSDLAAPAGYVITEGLSASIAPFGGTDTFTVALTGTPGTYTGAVQFNSNDGDESPFDLNVTGVITPDTDFPTATISLMDKTPTPGNWMRYSVVFSESVGASFDASDITTSGTLASGATVSVSGSDPSYVVKVTPADPGANGTIAIVIGSGVTDLAGNAYAGGVSAAYTIDNSIRMVEYHSPNSQTFGWFGGAVASVPDTNGDGINEILVGAEAEGRAYIYDGGSFTLLGTFVSPNPEASGYFGGAVAGIADINADGHGDLAVGARSENSSAGRVYVFDGATHALLRTLSASGATRFGEALASIGDVNGDGKSDLIVGALRSYSNSGRVYVMNASTGEQIHVLTSPRSASNGYFGDSVASMPDATGDGIDDIAVGATGEASSSGYAYIYNGATGALVREFHSPNAESSAQFGWSVAGIHDLDGDGRGDLIVGAPYETAFDDSDAGRAYVFSGATGALIFSPAPSIHEGNDGFGRGVAGTPDVNGDSIDDIIIGQDYGYPDGPYGRGMVWVYSGANAELLGVYHSSFNEAAGFGWAVAAMGDMNGDGLGDILAGSYFDWPAGYAQQSGGAYVLLSAPQSEVGVYRDGNMIPSGGEVSFGTVYQEHDTTPTVTLTVFNNAGTTLTTSNLSAPAGFIVTEGLNAQIAPFTSDTLTVAMSMATTGTLSGALTFENNDGDENPYTITLNGTVHAPDTEAPTVASITRSGSTPTHASTVDFTVTFSEAVTGVAAGNFSIDATGPADASVVSVTGSGTAWTVTVNTGSGDGQLSIDLNQNLAGITDGADNPLAVAFTAGESYEIDKAAPSDITLSSSSMNEHVANGTVVGVISTTDDDAENAFSYSLVEPYYNAGARFTVVGNELRVLNTSSINYESATSHMITVRATENGGLYFDKSFTITINNVNETPTNITLSATAVNENAANDTAVGNLAAADPDTGDTFGYSFVAPNGDAGGRFKIAGSQIQVANGALLDYESAASHAVTVRVTDNGGLTYDKSFTITVNNVNEAPTAASLSGTVIDENAASDTVVGTLSTTDQDAGATFTYSFVAPNSDAGGRFKISGNQLQVANGALLDCESAASHQVTVRTTDNGGLTFDQSFTINVRNVNEAPSDVALSNSVIDENAANNTVVATLSATDQDTTNTFAYSFVAPNSDAGGRFKIVGNQIQVASLLDYETSRSLAVTVQATDNGGLTVTKSFTIALRNVNDTPSDISLSGSAVNENAANYTGVGNLSAADQDTTNTFTYAFADPNSNAGGRFRLIGSQIQVANGSLLDYESAASHAITIRVTDNGGLYYEKSFTLTVNNVNETPTNVTLAGSAVNENAANDTVVGSLSSSDPDAGSTFTYSFVAPNNDAGGRFKIVDNQIQVANGGLLDYEAGASQLVTVCSMDNGGLTCTKSFTITLNNVNEAPTDISLSVSSVNENTPNDTVVATFTTTDQDAGSTFVYTFVAPNSDAGGRFKISNNQLLVANSSLLNYEAAASHPITVLVTDNTGLTYTKSLTIALQDVNETPTDIALSAAAVNENAAVNTAVGNLSTIDPDAGSTFTYAFVAPNNDAGGRFKIVGNQVQVADSSLLNYEAGTSHLITLRTTDNGGLAYEKSFTITVNNVNETPTNVSLSPSALNENSPVNTIVGNLSATDPDAGSTFTYSFVAPNSNAGGRFFISGSKIMVASGAVLNYEEASSRLVTVRVTDNGGLTYDKTITINLNDINEMPNALTLSGMGVNENSPTDTFVCNLIPGDPDAGSTFTYAFVAPYYDAGGRFKIVNGQILVANGALLDSEANYWHYISIQVTDNGGLSFSNSHMLNVYDVNDAPSDIRVFGLTVNENTATETIISAMLSTDQDSGNTFTYSFVPPYGDAGGRFKISGDRIKVANGALLDYESATSHLVTIRTTDNGGLTFDKTFTMAVTNVNETPTDIALSASAIDENPANNTVVGDLTSTDPDAGATFTYSFVAPNSSAGGRFKIVGSQVQVADGSLLDYESATSHLVTVRTTDQGGLTCDKTFTITLNNVNDAPTDISLSASTVAENAANDTPVGTLSSTDQDAGATFTYSLLDAAGGRFKIVGNQIQVADGTLLDYESAASHQVTVRTIDNGGLTHDKTFTITLTNANETPTGMALSAAAVDENAAQNTQVGSLSTTDPDSGDTFAYSFVAPGLDAGGRFKIAGNQLQVASSSLLDYEAGTSHQVTIRATDAGGLTFDKSFTITINNVNEAPTDISLSASAVDENTSNGTVVGDLGGTDQDAGATFSYSFVAPNSDAGGRFQIVGDQIRVANGTLLDYESAASHQVTVRATDNGGLAFDKSFTVTINNVNEAPTDISISANTVSENAANNTVVSGLSAADQDAGATFTYAFAAPNNDAGGRFKIAGSQIQVANGTLLDYETATSHMVTVRATDNGGLGFTKTFTINVINVAEFNTSLLVGATPIANGGGPINFGTVDMGATGPSITFTLRNNGDTTLTTSNLGAPNGYSIVNGLAPAIAPGGSDTFTVALLTSAAGTFSGTVSFHTNDPGASTYQFSVTGTVNSTTATYVDFGYLGSELGTQTQPFNTLAEGIAGAGFGGTLYVAAGTTSETPRMTKAMRLRAVGGTVRIGVGAQQGPAPDSTSQPNRLAPMRRNAASDWALYR